VDRGASVLGLDREPRMAALARQRLEGRARAEVADVGEAPGSGRGNADGQRSGLTNGTLG